LTVFDASSLVGAAAKANGVPRQALGLARDRDRIALSSAVFEEINDVLHRPGLARFLLPELRDEVIQILISGAVWFEPSEMVADCRDETDNKFLELAQASLASIIVSSDNDLLVLDPWRDTRILRPAAYVALMRIPLSASPD
jgi:putative PIN family toxin of toxin-antitoxin system